MLVSFSRQAEATSVQKAKSSYNTGLTDSSFNFSTSQADCLLNKVSHLSSLWKNAEGVHEKAYQKGTLLPGVIECLQSDTGTHVLPSDYLGLLCGLVLVAPGTLPKISSDKFLLSAC